MATVNVKFRASKIDGKAGKIFYQLYHNKVFRQLKSGYTIYPNEWCSEGDSIIVDDSNGERAKQLRLISGKVRYELHRFNKLAKSLETAGELDHCDNLLLECQKLPPVVTLFSYLKTVIAECVKLGEQRKARNYSNALKSFSRFRDGEDLVFENISLELIEQYERYLKNNSKSMNTISYYLRNLRAICNQAAARGVIKERDIFSTVFTGYDKTVKPTLSLDDVRKIKEYELPANSKDSLARDLFLFSFYTKGMTFVDMLSLRKSDLSGGILSYQKRQRGQRFYIKWEQCMQEIVDRYNDEESLYLLPIASRIKNKEDIYNNYVGELVRVNYSLKKLSKIMKLEVAITMNVARNSWALAAKRKNIPISIISESLGYATNTETMLFLESLDRSMVDEANSVILDDVL